MKKIISTILCVLMFLCLTVNSLAGTESDGNGSTLQTQLNFTTGTNASYTVTVPESLTLGTTASNATAATVTIQGATEVAKTVSASTSVTLKTADQKQSLAATISFSSLQLPISVSESATKTGQIKAYWTDGVAPSIGTWSGNITYTVA